MHKTRLLIVLGIATLLAFAVGARLFDLQILHGEEYETIARENRVQIRLIPPLRGKIVDRRGRLLAEERPRWTVRLNLSRMRTAAEIAEILTRDSSESEASVRRAMGNGWRRRKAREVRAVRAAALGETLTRLARILPATVESMRLTLRSVERNILEEESRERVRVLTRVLADRPADRIKVRRLLRKSEQEINRSTLEGLEDGDFLLVTGFRWSRLDPGVQRRREAVLGMAARFGANVEKVLKELNETERATRRHAVRAVSRRDHVLFERFLDYGVVVNLEMALEDLPGVSVCATPSRIYPRGSCACHVLGYVGYLGWSRRAGEDINRYAEMEEGGYFFRKVSDFLDRKEYETLESRGEFLRDKFGKTGVESRWDEGLRGRRGARVVETDRRRRVQRNLAVHPPCHGITLTLTLDAEVQETGLKAFARVPCPKFPKDFPCRGAAVVLDVRTGAVIALISVPGFDLNDMIPPVSSQACKKLFQDGGRPLLNRAVAGCYEPGSTFKAVSAFAALSDGMIKPSDAIGCQGSYKRYNHTFRCNARYGHGQMDLESALMQSCNVYFYTLGDRLGSTLGVWAEVFGFGRPTGIDLPGERAGTLPSGMLPGVWVQLAIGQGMTATPLQVARFTALVANGGTLVVPHVVGPPQPGVAVQIAPGILKAVRKGYRQVVFGSRGTARLPLLRRIGAAGKTGTAETGRKRDGVSLNHAWFTGYAPLSDPRLAVAVVVEDVPHGIHGGDIAAPIAAILLESALSAVGREP